MPTPTEALDLAFLRASRNLGQALVNDSVVVDRLEFVCRNIQNRAGVRLLLSCLTAKVSDPSVDIRKPYTEIGHDDAYSGRTIDETHVSPFINRHNLPCNSTTAFLTPALRDRNVVLTLDIDLVGRPPELYKAVLQLLAGVHTGNVSETDMLAETVRWLLIIRDERSERMRTLLSALRSTRGMLPLPSEGIVALIQQHFSSPRSSRLPVLVVAAAYKVATDHLKERIFPLESHTAADEQTGALGDVQIALMDDDEVITAYEMKMRRVSVEDIERALAKINDNDVKPDNYIFITTDTIDDKVRQYAESIYEQTGGIEVVILDCISFLRHFLHLFHRLRQQFLDAYQELLLAEPDSAVSQPLKEVFLALRQAAEYRE